MKLNLIEKKQVNVPDSWKLQYNPDCSVILLTHPITNIDEELLVRGSFRRFVILFINVPEDERLEALKNTRFLTKKEDAYNKMWNEWIQFNKSLLEYKNLNYACSEEDLKLIDEYIEKIRSSIIKSGQEVNEFYWTILFTMKINIFKMSIIRAIVSQHIKNNNVTIKSMHIQQAIFDWEAIWLPQVQWIARQLKIQSLTPIGWNEALHGFMWTLINSLYKDKEFTSIQLIEAYKKEKDNKNKSENVIRNNVYRTLQDFTKWGNLRKFGVSKNTGYSYSIQSKDK